MPFKDHFSGHSIDYSKYRPTYPAELFEFIIKHVSTLQTAWDCGTGNGQAAVMLANYFDKVIATDASQEQINNAIHHNKVEYKVCVAGKTPIRTRSIDLITAAQALHWFSYLDFFKVVKRVAKHGATIAIWGYEVCTVNQEIDIIFNRLYKDILGNYWPPERKLVEKKYSTIPFSFENVIENEFFIEKNWNLTDYCNFLKTWSAYQQYRKEHIKDPLGFVMDSLENAWGKKDESRIVKFPVFLKIGFVA